MADKSGPAARLVWLWNRARSMSVQEIPFRLREVTRTVSDRRRDIAPGCRDVDTLADHPLPAWPIALERLSTIVAGDAERLDADVATVLRGDMTLLGVQRPSGSRKAWWLAPDDGTQWPRHGFARTLDLYHGQKGREIKLAWELARFQHLQLLALAVRFGRNESATQACLNDIEQFIGENPPFRGIHWYSGIECSSRIMSWLIVIGLLGPEAVDADLRRKLWRALYTHAWWIMRYPSRYSSANNHRIAELAGVYSLCCLAPRMRHATRWRRACGRELAIEFNRQILPDGVGAEQSLAYQAYSMEWFLAARHAGLQTGYPLPASCDRRLLAGARFLASLHDEAGNLPAIGDDDESVVFRQTLAPDSLPTSVAGVVATLFSDSDCLPPGWSVDARAVLLGADHAAVPNVPAARPGRIFPDGGYSVLRTGHARAERLVIVDHGSLGYLTAAHGHADALAVWFHVDGWPVLVDTGTWRYNGVEAWRTWVRSTLAHNTVRVDGLEQSEPTGRFNWGRRCAARLLDAKLTAAGGWIEAEHDGFQVWARVVHRRRVELAHHRLLVEDTLVGEGDHEIEIALQLAPDLHVEESGSNFARLMRGTEAVGELAVEGSVVSIDKYHQTGDAGPGWISPAFNRLVPATTLVVRGQSALPARWTWSISLL